MANHYQNDLPEQRFADARWPSLRRLIARIGGELHEIGFAPFHAVPLVPMIVSLFRLRHDESVGQFFSAGSRTTTPASATLDPVWPRPWVFLRVFLLLALLCALFFRMYYRFPNTSICLGLLAVGALSVPFSIVVWFMEMNVPRNISLPRVMAVMLAGGSLSLMFAKAVDIIPLIAHVTKEHRIFPLAALIEEIAKAAVLILPLSNRRHRYTLNGLVFGAAVGAGFAVLENAGFALHYGTTLGGMYLYPTLVNRTLLSAGSHVAWTALAGGALWHAARRYRVALMAYADWRFLVVLALVMMLHILWNLQLAHPCQDSVWCVLGAVVWLAILHMIQGGLNEIRADAAHHTNL